MHRGLLRSARLLLAREAPFLSHLLLRCHPTATLTLAGHSLGAGVALLLALLLLHAEEGGEGGEERRGLNDSHNDSNSRRTHGQGHSQGHSGCRREGHGICGSGPGHGGGGELVGVRDGLGGGSPGTAGGADHQRCSRGCSVRAAEAAVLNGGVNEEDAGSSTGLDGSSPKVQTNYRECGNASSSVDASQPSGSAGDPGGEHRRTGTEGSLPHIVPASLQAAVTTLQCTSLHDAAHGANHEADHATAGAPSSSSSSSLSTSSCSLPRASQTEGSSNTQPERQQQKQQKQTELPQDEQQQLQQQHPLSLPASRIRCFAFSPPRCVSLPLAAQYESNIASVVLQVRQMSG